MGENVVPFGEATLRSERKAQFLETVALSFDSYVSTYGFEPEAIVYVVCGITQPSRIAWQIEGESKRGVSSCIALAGAHMLAEVADQRSEP